MYRFNIKLAGRIVEVNSLYEDTRLLCRDYLVADGAEPDIIVCTTEADIAREIDPEHEYSEGYLETLAVYRKIAEAMLDYDTMLFHGTALAVDGAAYIFTAPSGTGKSTHRRLWQQLFGDALTVVNDDKPLIRVESGRVYVCGTPWSGVHNINTNVELPLKAICLLERGEENKIEALSFAETMPFMLSQSYMPQDAKLAGKTLSVLDRIADKLKFYRLRCNMEEEAARVAYEGITKE